MDIRNQPAAPESYSLPEGFGDYLVELPPVFQSGKFIESGKPTPSGTLYESTISLNIAKDKPAAAIHVNQLQQRTWSVLWQDQNGQYRLTGSKAYPMRVAIQRNSGADISDLNHIHLEFVAPSAYPSIFIGNPF